MVYWGSFVSPFWTIYWFAAKHRMTNWCSFNSGGGNRLYLQGFVWSFPGVALGPRVCWATSWPAKDWSRLRKDQAILEFPTPKNTKELQRFLGFISCYRKFFKDFVRIVGQLCMLKEGDVILLGIDVHWSFLQVQECDPQRCCATVFLILKRHLRTTTSGRSSFKRMQANFVWTPVSPNLTKRSGCTLSVLSHGSAC